MNNLIKVIMHTYCIIEILALILVPYILILNNIDYLYCFMSGWNIGLFSPNVALQHEWMHDISKRWYTKILYEVTVGLYILGPLFTHHKYSHHRYANTLKDHAHPHKDISKIKYIYEYTIAYLPDLIRYDKIRVLSSITIGLFFCISLFFIFGIKAVFFYLGAIVGFHYTAISGNYVQHYGLETLPVSDQEKIVFAWDDSGIIGKYTHFNLHIHSDHHSNSLKSFDKLRNVKGKPLLPYSLPTMMMLFPFPQYEKIMNKRLEEYCSKIKVKI